MNVVLVIASLFASLYPDYGHVAGADFAEIGPAEYRPFRRELRAFYPRECHEPPKSAAVTNSFATIHRLAAAWSAARPGHSALELRRQVYALEREHFVPVLFPGSPFYFEAGVNGGYHRGEARGETPQPGRVTRALCDRFFRERGLVPEAAWARKDARSRHLFGLSCGAFVDEVHDLPPFHAVFTKGFGGIRREVAAALTRCPADDDEGRAELEAMVDALDTVHALQLRFHDEAVRLRREERMVAASARCPWEPPRTFYEGLNTLWFMREMMAYVDGLCCNALGRPDAWLIDLYRRDLEAGRLTETEARDLVARFMILSDCHIDGFSIVDGAADQEAEMPITLGGCDAGGRPVWNELTRLFIEEHRRLALVFPKLHVRFSDNSPRDYLELIARTVIGGHCVFALFNDDTHIPMFVSCGLSLDRARDYEGTGCWDGFVDTATDGSVGNYTSAIQPLVAAIHRQFAVGGECGCELRPLDGAKSFGEFRDIAYGNYLRMLKAMLDDYTRYGGAYGLVSPCPLYSACLDGCVGRRRDCRRGGLSWAPRVINVGFLANVVDSLCAVEKVVYADRFCSLDEFLAAVRADWKGERAEAIRREVFKAPHWGDNRPESNREMRQWIESLARDLKPLSTDQGGSYELACWIYREFVAWGERSPATPDGRRAGDRFAQGFAPSEYRCRSSVADVFHAIASLDHTKLFASNANLTFGGEDLTPETLAACFRVYAAGGGHLLQPNVNDVETLLDAQRHPERHQDLMVKVCGYSARFVTLSPRYQREVIERHRLSVGGAREDLSFSVDPASGVLTVEDRAGGVRYETHPSAYPVRDVRREGSALVWTLEPTTNLAVTARLERVGPRELRLRLSAAAEAPLASPVAYPPAWCLAKGDTCIWPFGEGMAYPADDLTVKMQAERLSFASGMDLAMGFFGFLRGDACVMTGIAGQCDALLFVKPCGETWSASPAWRAENGRWAYDREVRFFFAPSLPAACADYRRWRESRGEVRTLREKLAKTPALADLVGAADVWLWDDNTQRRLYNWPLVAKAPPRDSRKIAAEMKALGLDRVLWNSFDGETPETCAYLKSLGYLVGTYDCLRDIFHPGLAAVADPKNFAMASRFMDCADEIVRRESDGSPALAWSIPDRAGKMHPMWSLCDMMGPEMVRRFVIPQIRAVGYTSRLMDVQAGGGAATCFSKAHPCTRRSGLAALRREHRMLGEEAGQVVGVEVGQEALLDAYHYAEGLTSCPHPFRKSLCWRFKDRALYGDEVPEDTKAYLHNPARRIPLWELVYHDCAVNYYYWADTTLMYPELTRRKDLFCALNGLPPIYSMNVSTWNRLKGAVADSYRRATPVARETMFERMTDFAWLSSDRLVQRSRFANGVEVVVNFGKSPVVLPDGREVPPETGLVGRTRNEK